MIVIIGSILKRYLYTIYIYIFIINFIVTEEASCSINACKMNFEGARDALLIRLKNVTVHGQKCGELQQMKIIFIFTDA